jgi:SAM-dependent methyltransferase
MLVLENIGIKTSTHINYVFPYFAQYNGDRDGRGFQNGKWNQKQLDTVSDITKIPEPNKVFYTIMCVRVEHLPESLMAIKEFKRLLKPNGPLIITVPFCSFTDFAPYPLYYGYNRHSITKNIFQNRVFRLLRRLKTGIILNILRRFPLGSHDYFKVRFSPFDYIAQPIFVWTLERCQRNRSWIERIVEFWVLVLGSMCMQ